MTVELDAIVERLAAEAAGGEGVEAYAELTTETSVTAFQGEVTTPVRGANLVGDGPSVVAAVDALGNDFTVKEGICGKEGQGVPVGNGAPTMRISQMTVGGTGGPA